MSNAQFTLGLWGSLHVKEDKWKETEQYTSLIPQGTWKKNSLLENPFKAFFINPISFMSVKCIEKKMYDFIQKQTSPCITTVLNHVHNQHQKSKVSTSCDDKVFMHSNWTSRGRTNGGNSVINRLLPCSTICQVSSSKV